MKSADDEEALARVFSMYCSFGKGSVVPGRVACMEGSAFVKLVVEAGLVEPPLDRPAIDLIFRRTCLRGQRRMSFSQFRLLAIPLLAQERWPHLDLVEAVRAASTAIQHAHAPSLNASGPVNMPDVIARLTNVGAFTGRHRTVHASVAEHPNPGAYSGREGGAEGVPNGSPPQQATTQRSGGRRMPAPGTQSPMERYLSDATDVEPPPALEAFDFGEHEGRPTGLQPVPGPHGHPEEAFAAEPGNDVTDSARAPPFEADVAYRTGRVPSNVPWPPTLQASSPGQEHRRGGGEPNVVRRMRSRAAHGGRSRSPSPGPAQGRGRAQHRRPEARAQDGYYTSRPRSMSPQGVGGAGIPPRRGGSPGPGRRNRSSSPPPPPPPETTQRLEGRLKEVFLQYCVFGVTRTRDVRMLDSFRAAKLVRECGILEGGITQTEVDLAFARLTGNSSRRMSYEAFKQLLAFLACKRFPDASPYSAFTELASRVCAAPNLTDTTKGHHMPPNSRRDVVSRLTDPSQYTGAHKLKHEDLGDRGAHVGHRWRTARRGSGVAFGSSHWRDNAAQRTASAGTLRTSPTASPVRARWQDV